MKSRRHRAIHKSRVYLHNKNNAKLKMFREFLYELRKCLNDTTN